jgi:hypothetical protein
VTFTLGLLIGVTLVAASAILFILGRSIALRWPGNAWVVSFGRVMLGVAGLGLVASGTVFARQDVTCGIVVGIDQVSLTDVHGFSLRSVDGRTSSWRIEAGRLAPDSFVPGHLREHFALSAPVCVSHDPGDSLALDLRDGPTGSPAATPAVTPAAPS